MLSFLVPSSSPPKRSLAAWRTRPKDGDDLFTACLRRGYFPVLVAAPRLILAAWLGVVVVCIIYGPAFLSSTVSSLALPAGTPSTIAISAFDVSYPGTSSYPPVFVVSETTSGNGGVLCNATARASSALDAYALLTGAGVVSSVTGYYEFEALNLGSLASATVSPSNNIMVQTVNFEPDTTIEEINSFVDKLLPWSAEQSGDGITVSTTGLFALFHQMSSETEKNFVLIDATVLPIAIVILGWRVRSYRHMLVAFINLACTILLSFGILTPISKATPINPFAPSILLSLGIAVCFDYSLFLLMRFREELLEPHVIAGIVDEGAGSRSATGGDKVISATVEVGGGVTPHATGEGGAAVAQEVVAAAQEVVHAPLSGKCCGATRTTVEDAVFVTLSSAGHVVLLSGSTLIATFALLVFLPQDFLTSVGWACGTVILASIITNLSITPCLLLAFPCFSTFEPVPTCCCSRKWALRCGATPRSGDLPALTSSPSLRKEVPPVTSGDASVNASGSEGVNSIAGSMRALHARLPPMILELPPAPPRASCLLRTSCAAKRPWLALSWELSRVRMQWCVFVAVIAATAPLAYCVSLMSPSSDEGLVYLQGSSSLNTLERMRGEFSVGALDPYSMMLQTPQGSVGVFSEQYFKTELAVIEQLLLQDSAFVDAASITGLSFFQSMPVSLNTSLAWLTTNASSPAFVASDVASAYRVLVGGLPSADRSASIVQIETTINPNSQGITAFIVDVRALATRLLVTPIVPGFTVSVYFLGGYTTTLDVQTLLYSLLGTEVGAVVAIVVLIISVSFRSVIVALRLILSIALSLIWTYGLMVLIYQPGRVQDALAVLTPILAESSSIYWIIPFMSFSILVGLALDYDIFLVSRILEYRMMGWSDRASVALAIEKTGPVITTAGLIMCVSFVGLLIPKTIVLQQYGCVLFLGVAIDTFIMRPLVIPALFSSLASAGGERVNWWPRRMPPVLLSHEEEEVALLQDGAWAPPSRAVVSKGASEVADADQSASGRGADKQGCDATTL